MKNDHTQPSRPAIIIPDRIDIPTPQVQALPNGVRLYTLDCTDRDVVRFSFVFRAGTSLQKTPFSASSTANLLSEGTARHSAQEIAEILDFHGSYYNVSLDRDYAVITFVSLLKFFEQTLAIAREILLEPAFDEAEVETYKAKRKQRLTIERSKISVKARELFVATLFGREHPYGEYYSEELYDGLRREDITEFYSRRYTAENCFVVCSGMIGEREKSGVGRLAAELPTGGDSSVPVFPPTSGERFRFEEHPEALQSAIRTGTMLFTRTHPDFISMQVVSTLLGGYFGSRLVRNLREEKGYTYGVFSSVINLEYSGYLAIATEVGAEATGDAVRQIFNEIERLRAEPVSAHELDMVRNIMIGEVLRVLDGPFGIADVTIENLSNGMDNSYLDEFLRQVRTITPEKVLSTAQKYMDPEKFTTVVVGSREP